MNAQKVLVVGGGGREHAIIRALARTSALPLELLCAPGNPGIARDARCFPGVVADDIDAVVALAVAEQVRLVVVGPEVPLVLGIVDALEDHEIAAFGPTQAAARLEGSKVFSKEVMAAAGVPTAHHTVLKNREQALAQIACASYPTVLKSDGLAAGKGVIICPDEASARKAVDAFFVERRFGETTVVLEEYLDGRELSLLAVCDGERAIPMTPARDFKRIFDNDEGPNTGGMGSFSPVPEVPDDQIAALSELVHRPIIDELARRGSPFHGILYAGLMMTDAGPKVLEYNTRFGDPETQAILPRMQSDLFALMLATTHPGGLSAITLEWSDDAAVTLTLASAGYPVSSSKGDVIAGLDAVADGIEITHAGTATGADGTVVTAGGRVLNITALGPSVADARERAYEGAKSIGFRGMQLRSDIASGI